MCRCGCAASAHTVRRGRACGWECCDGAVGQGSGGGRELQCGALSAALPHLRQRRGSSLQTDGWAEAPGELKLTGCLNSPKAMSMVWSLHYINCIFCMCLCFPGPINTRDLPLLWKGTNDQIRDGLCDCRCFQPAQQSFDTGMIACVHFLFLLLMNKHVFIDQSHLMLFLPHKCT